MIFPLADELKYSSNITQTAIGLLRAAILLMGFLIALVTLNFKFHVLASITIVPTMIALISITSAILSFCGIVEDRNLATKVQEYLSNAQQALTDHEHLTLGMYFARDRFRRQGFINRAAFLLLSALLLSLSIIVLLLAEKFGWREWWDSLTFSLETVLPSVAFGLPVLILLLWEATRYGKRP